MAINTSKTVSSLTYNGTPLTLAPNITYGYSDANGADSTSITFSNLNGKPKVAIVQTNTGTITGTEKPYVINILVNASYSTVHNYCYESSSLSSAQICHVNDCCTASYADGNLTIITTSMNFGVFKSGVNYSLHYYY